MSCVAVFSIFIVAVAVAGAYAQPTPTSNDRAIGFAKEVCYLGKRDINVRIDVAVQRSNNDPTLTASGKDCFTKKAEQLREEAVATIDDTCAAVLQEIRTSSVSLTTALTETTRPIPIKVASLTANLRGSLYTARSDCIAQTATA